MTTELKTTSARSWRRAPLLLVVVIACLPGAGARAPELIRAALTAAADAAEAGGAGIAAAAAAAATPSLGVSLERDVGVPPPYNWTGGIAWAQGSDPDVVQMLRILQQYAVPAATLGWQLNPNRTRFDNTAPTQFQSPQAWWMAGFGLPALAPLRVASVSKPLTYAVWMNFNSLRARLDSPFYALWESEIGVLPLPRDPRVLSISVRQLLDHRSGFTNKNIGTDPAFLGRPVATLLPGILSSTLLASNPGAAYAYSNLGYMIAARLASAITRRRFISLVRGLFPQSSAPVYAASDTVPVPESSRWGPGEPSLYWSQGEAEFDVSVMAGSGNIVTNCAALTWFGTQYWIGGAREGARFGSVPLRQSQRGSFWLMNGSMPGTLAVLGQHTSGAGYVASICIIVPTRMPQSTAFLEALNTAALDFLEKKAANLG